MTTNRIKASTIEDLISIPRIMLGFVPTESVVVIGIGTDGTRVQFCARMDIAHVNADSKGIAAQVNNASTQGGIGQLAVFGFSDNPEQTAATMAPLIDALDAYVIECLAVTPSHWWNVIGDGLVGDSTPYDAKNSSASVQAVVAGENVLEDRTAAVAAVQGPRRSGEDYADLVNQTAHIIEQVTAMTGQDQIAAAVALVTQEGPLSAADCARLAALMNTPEGNHAVLSSITESNAPTYHVRLAEARRMTPFPVAAEIVAVLAVACWLSGEGAQFADCLTQLNQMDPGNPLGALLATIHNNALPPHKWDELNS